MSDAIVLPTHPLFKNLAGQRFGLLTVLSYVGQRGPKKRSAWLCRCDCSTEKIISATRLQSGTESCGCLRLVEVSKAKTTHGMSKSPEYGIWCGMRERCSEPTCECYRYYGGRGITVCERWSTFENFYADMGPRPSPKHEIDRENNNGNYEPGNCRWVVRLVNARNRGNNRRITFRGETLCVSQWAERIGLPRHTIEKRLDTGWDLERAMLTPKRAWNRGETLTEAVGQ